MFNDSTKLIFKTIFHTAFFQTSCPRQHKKRKNFYFERLTPKRDFSISLTISKHGWTGILHLPFIFIYSSIMFKWIQVLRAKAVCFFCKARSFTKLQVHTHAKFPLPRLFKNLQPACFTNFIVFHRIAAATGLIERCKGKSHLRFWRRRKSLSTLEKLHVLNGVLKFVEEFPVIALAEGTCLLFHSCEN